MEPIQKLRHIQADFLRVEMNGFIVWGNFEGAVVTNSVEAIVVYLVTTFVPARSRRLKLLSCQNENFSPSIQMRSCT